MQVYPRHIRKRNKDSNSLTQQKLDVMGQCWIAVLADYNIQLLYKTGKANVEAHALSHIPWHQMVCLLLWQMLLLNLMLWCGRWWATEADVIASWLSNGRCYSLVADGIATFRVDLFQLKFWDVKQNLIPYEANCICLCSYWRMDCSTLYILLLW